MDPAIASSIISTAGAGAANLVGSALERRSQKEQQDLARRQSIEDRQHNEWYNSPALQRERLRQAGLGISNDTVKPDDTSSENMQYAQPFTNDILNSRSTGLQQLAQTPADAMKFALEMAEQTSRIEGLSTDNDLKHITLKYADENARLALDKSYNELLQGKQQLVIMRNSARLTRKQAALLDVQIKYADRLEAAKTKLAECEAHIAQNRQRISDETVDAEIVKSWNDVQQQMANLRFTQAQISNICAATSKLNAETANLEVTGQILLENLTQEQLKSQFDGRTLEERIRSVTVGANFVGYQATGQRLDNEKKVRDAQAYGVQKVFDCLTGIVGMSINAFNAGTQRMVGNSLVEQRKTGVSPLVDSNGKNFATYNGQIVGL